MRDHWQPIETAPKDGTDVLLASVSRVTAEMVFTVGHYHYRSAKWFDRMDAYSIDTPTHWQPLVPPNGGNNVRSAQ